jgi:AmmeMemoRadiSam system protein B
MNIRKPCLPPGWYPQEAGKIRKFLENTHATCVPSERCDTPALAAIAPHAGWYYSGAIAARSVSALDSEAETVAVLGGHLPAGIPPLYFEEDGVETPLGPMMIDTELRSALKRKLPGRPDTYQDNTVEVLLPMVRYYFPNAHGGRSAQLLALRLPAEPASYDAGTILAETAAALGRRITVLGSTDLTHYGPNYGFCPRGLGAKALDWVRDVNDAHFIKAVLSGDPGAVLARAEEDSSACSAGAVLAAMGFAKTKAHDAALLQYGTSADAGPETVPDSFVGYASIAWT